MNQTLLQTLLKQEAVFFHPKNGSFDVGKIQAQALSLDHSWQDPTIPKNILVFLSENSKKVSVSKIEQQDKKEYPYVLVIAIQEDEVYVNQFGGPEFLQASGKFMKWMLENYDCLISNEETTVLSE